MTIVHFEQTPFTLCAEICAKMNIINNEFGKRFVNCVRLESGLCVVVAVNQMLNTGIIIGCINRAHFIPHRMNSHRSSYSSIKPFCCFRLLFRSIQMQNTAPHSMCERFGEFKQKYAICQS